MKIKTSELEGSALDWAVALCEQVELAENNAPIWFGDSNAREPYTPSTNWGQGGPIIEREIYEVLRCGGVGRSTYFECCAGFEDDEDYVMACGPTVLIAGMRCFVMRKHGSEVEIPEELL